MFENETVGPFFYRFLFIRNFDQLLFAFLMSLLIEEVCCLGQKLDLVSKILVRPIFADFCFCEDISCFNLHINDSRYHSALYRLPLSMVAREIISNENNALYRERIKVSRKLS